MLLTSEPPEPTGIGQDVDRSELLRQILAAEQRREVAYKEARETGETLLDFYQVLAEGVDDEPTE